MVRTGAGRLCRAADVTVVEAADQGQRDDAAVIGWLDGSRLGRVLVEGEVRREVW